MLQFIRPREHMRAVCPPNHRLTTSVQKCQAFAVAGRSRWAQYAKKDETENEYLPGPEEWFGET